MFSWGSDFCNIVGLVKPQNSNFHIFVFKTLRTGAKKKCDVLYCWSHRYVSVHDNMATRDVVSMTLLRAGSI